MFKKYSSIENSYRTAFVDKCHDLGCDDWVVTEKVHGANFSFICDGRTVIPAKRSGVIGKNPNGVYDFYNCNPVVEKYYRAVMNLFGFLNDDLKSIQVFGELYGEGIQKNVAYGEKDFIVFDIHVTGQESNYWLHWDELVKWCNHVELPVVPVLDRGSLDNMMTLTSEFDSVLADLNGFECKAEGVVIKPADGNFFLRNGSRPVIKNKSEKFSEKSRSKKRQLHTTLTTEEEEFVSNFMAYINDNRLTSLLSKIGTPSTKDFGMVQGKLVQDAKIDFEKDEYEIPEDLWKQTKKTIQKLSADFIRRKWVTIISGEF